jgi:hypothetical protein
MQRNIYWHLPLIQAFPNEQAFPQAPQLSTDVMMLVSQPFIMLPSQFAKPSLQVKIVQEPLTQPATALGKAHALAQAPQLLKDVPIFISHPSAGFPLQFAKPCGQSMVTITWSELVPQGFDIVHCKL